MKMRIEVVVAKRKGEDEGLKVILMAKSFCEEDKGWGWWTRDLERELLDFVGVIVQESEEKCK